MYLLWMRRREGSEKYGRSFEGLGSGIPNKLRWQEKERSEFLCHKAKLALNLL